MVTSKSKIITTQNTTSEGNQLIDGIIEAIIYPPFERWFFFVVHKNVKRKHGSNGKASIETFE